MATDSTQTEWQPSRRMQPIRPSAIREMSRHCARLGGINLGQGVCDTPTPSPVARGAIAAIEARQSLYSFPEGVDELRLKIADKLAKDNGLQVDPEREIVVTCGATGGYTSALHAFLNPGDGIMLFEPYYGYHYNTALLAGLEPQVCELSPPRFEITKERLEAARRDTTRALVLCSPGNPSGRMLSAAEIEICGRFAEKHNLLILSDEIYEYFRYDDRPHLSVAAHDDFAARTVTIMGASKTFSITGWRIGYAVAPAALAEPLKVANDNFYVCAPTPLQHGVAAGLDLGDDYYRNLRNEYQAKRDRFCATLEKCGLPPIVPEGAYYVLADIRSLRCENSMAAAMKILKTARVASVPGSAFFQSAAGNHYVRFCFAVEDEVLDRAIEQLAASDW